GVFQWNAENDQAFWENDRMYEIFGRSREDGPLPLKAFLEETIDPARAGQFGTAFDDAMRREEQLSIVTRVRRKRDGAWRWVQFDSRFARNADGQMAQIGIAMDITERKLASAALEASEARYRTLVEAAPIAAVTYNESGITFANRAAVTLLGASDPGQLIGRPMRDFLHPDYHAVAKQRERRVLERGMTNPPLEFEFIRLDGTAVEAEASSVPYEDPNGRGVQTLLRDISARKRVEREREELLRREQAARRQAEEANRLKDEFLATVSHELRNPLSAITGWAHLLRMGRLDPPRTTRAIDAIARNARAQAQLVDDLLDVSRIIGGKMRLNPRRLELKETVENAIVAVRPAAEAKGIRLEIMIDPAAGLLAGDPDRLQQVLWNLLSNAIKFTPAGGSVRFEAKRAASHFEITVADDGIGISAEMLPFVFDRFRQADSASNRKFGGLGLGLAIVRHLVEMHGGTVNAYSEGEGKGAVFSVRLPLTMRIAALDADEPDSALAPDELPAAAGLHGVRVLVVDDEADTREMIAEILREAQAEVATAGSSTEALELVNQWRPDVLIADIAMPGEDGYALISQLRARPSRNGGRIPAAALTAYARVEDRMRALSAGFNLHLAKPVQPAELLAVVASLVQRQ
ncbi:MAG: hybrid sensor histidine kinase/response regulator, partial [Candidatus Binataceae bacterium]